MMENKFNPDFVADLISEEISYNGFPFKLYKTQKEAAKGS